MTTYHPLARAIDGNGNEQDLLTYDGFSTLEECVKQFDLWQDHYGYVITKACVQIIKDGNTVETIFHEKKWIPVNND